MSWNDWLAQARQALMALRPNGPTGDDGAQLPALTAQDTIGTIGAIAPGVTNCLQTFAAQNSSQDYSSTMTVALRSDLLTGDGSIDIPSLASGISADTGLTAPKYLAAWPNPGAPHIRSLAQGAWAFGGSSTYELFVTSGETALLAFARQLVADWQRVLDASASAINVHAADITQTMETAEAQEFWAALGAVASDLDTLNENPPAATADVLVGALRASLNATADFAGKAVAEISNRVGDAAEKVASGFFSGIGISGAIVGAVVIYLFVIK
jgi:hypothetical protein